MERDWKSIYLRLVYFIPPVDALDRLRPAKVSVLWFNYELLRPCYFLPLPKELLQSKKGVSLNLDRLDEFDIFASYHSYTICHTLSEHHQVIPYSDLRGIFDVIP